MHYFLWILTACIINTPWNIVLLHLYGISMLPFEVILVWRQNISVSIKEVFYGAMLHFFLQKISWNASALPKLYLRMKSIIYVYVRMKMFYCCVQTVVRMEYSKEDVAIALSHQIFPVVPMYKRRCIFYFFRLKCYNFFSNIQHNFGAI